MDDDLKRQLKLVDQIRQRWDIDEEDEAPPAREDIATLLDVIDALVTENKQLAEKAHDLLLDLWDALE